MKQVRQSCSCDLVAVDIANDGMELPKGSKFGAEGMGEGDNTFIRRKILSNFIGYQVDDENPAAGPVVLRDQRDLGRKFSFSGIEIGIIIAQCEIRSCI